ncbi:MAG: hypothetical protein JWQ97_2171 [Phenylobacterium sp.]|nr:hypothetical protein [Phenylobacterium sp.]
MLSVIVTPGNPERLAGLLAALIRGVVESVVREVFLVGEAPRELLDALCDATGAKLARDLPDAIAQARSDWLMVVPPELRLADGWVERLADHLREGGGEARLEGPSAGFLKPRATGVVIARAKAEASAQGGLQQLARKLGRGARRLG